MLLTIIHFLIAVNKFPGDKGCSHVQNECMTSWFPCTACTWYLNPSGSLIPKNDTYEYLHWPGINLYKPINGNM